MRIALCLEYPLALKGGVSVLCRALAEGLSARHEIVLVSPDSAEEFAQIQSVAPFHSHVYWNPVTVSAAQSRVLAATLQKRGVQLAHFHFGGNFGWGSRLVGYCPIPYLVGQGVTVCSTVHLVVGPMDGYCGPEKPFWFKLALWPIAWVGKMHVLQHLRAEVVVSKFGTYCLRRWYWPLRNRFQTIYHSRMLEGAALPLTPPAEREKTVLYAGHIAVRKGQRVLVEAFGQIAERHPAWKLVLLGGGERDLEDQLRRLIEARSLQGRIELAGARDALDFMRRAEIFVQPSFFEGLPLALQEAMLSGCACVGTDIPGNDEIISTGDNGLLTPKGDVACLAEALDRLIRDEPMRRFFQERARASVLNKGMSAEQMIQHHLVLYERLLSTH